MSIAAHSIRRITSDVRRPRGCANVTPPARTQPLYIPLTTASRGPARRRVALGRAHGPDGRALAGGAANRAAAASRRARIARLADGPHGSPRVVGRASASQIL